MEIIRQKREYTIPNDYFFFDIETTNLSPKTSYIYLIGYMQMEGSECILTSVFCEDYNEEKELLLYFKEHYDSQKTLVHFNGSTFDIPYLNHKFIRHKMNYSLEGCKSLDIYKALFHYKKYFDTTDLKLKTVEYLAGYNRTDTFSGADLALLYEELTGMRRLYEVSKKADAFDRIKAITSCMLLHNAEDIDGLYYIYKKCGFLQEPHDITFEMTPYQLIINIPYPLFPVTFEADTGLYVIICSENATEMIISLKTGLLHYYFDDYKNYTYILSEGQAMLSSIATGIAKENKQKAGRELAFAKKEGIFLPVSKAYREYALDNHIYLFGESYKGRHDFVEFQSNVPFLLNYLKHLII